MTPSLPFLDALSLDDLKAMRRDLSALAEAGEVLAQFGMVPQFQLHPGAPMAIKLPLVMMPAAGVNRVTPQPFNPRDFLRPLPAPATPYPEPATEQDTLLVSQGDGTVVEVNYPFPAEQTADQPTQGLQLDVVAGQDGRAGVAATRPADPEPAEAVPVPGSASAVAAARPAPWSYDEDERAVDIYVSQLALGLTQAKAAAAVAKDNGRTVDGILFRLKNKLAPAVEAEQLRRRNLEALRRADAAPAAPVDVAAPAAPEPEPEPEGPRPDPATLTPIEAHLMAVPRKHGWTMERDFNLLDLACLGWNMNEISQELALDAGAVKARFDLLTGFNPETKARSWKREVLRDALAPWVAPTAAE